ncbi:hypothetical protein N7535_000534 [Penicillium sp. DV-2018c]|nr:hypothetical protein N7535_000534 [Penicillium sp. DV-2018c]
MVNYTTHGDAAALWPPPLQAPGSRKQRREDDKREVNQNTDDTYGQLPGLHPMSMLPFPSFQTGVSADLGTPYPAHVDPSGSHQTPNQGYSHPAEHYDHVIPPQGQSSMPSAKRRRYSRDTRESSPLDMSFLNMPGLPERFPERKPRTKFTEEEDAVTVELREVFKLSWRQIAWFFPGRRAGTLQVRYCTTLKERDITWDKEMDTKLKQVHEEYKKKIYYFIAQKLARMGLKGISPDASNHSRSGQSGFKLTQPQTSKLPLLPQTPRVIHPITSRTMFLQRTASALARRSPARAFTLAQRPFSSSIIRSDAKKWAPKQEGKILTFDGRGRPPPPGAKPGTIPTDVDQATGLERLELIGKMQGIDIFDMRPLDASRKGTLQDPIIVNSAGDEQYAGCTGYPVDSHQVNWLTVTRERPIERCGECGNVVKMNYIGPEEDPHAHDHGHHHPAPVEPKTFADYVKPEYWYR